MITDGEQAYRKRKYAALHAQASKHGWDDAQTREWRQSNYDVNSATVLKQMLCDSKKLWVFVGFCGFLWVFWQSKASRNCFAKKNGGMRVCAKMTQNKCDSVLKHYGGV